MLIFCRRLFAATRNNRTVVSLEHIKYLCIICTVKSKSICNEIVKCNPALLHETKANKQFFCMKKTTLIFRQKIKVVIVFAIVYFQKSQRPISISYWTFKSYRNFTKSIRVQRVALLSIPNQFQQIKNGSSLLLLARFIRIFQFNGNKRPANAISLYSHCYCHIEQHNKLS